MPTDEICPLRTRFFSDWSNLFTLWKSYFSLQCQHKGPKKKNPPFTLPMNQIFGRPVMESHRIHLFSTICGLSHLWTIKTKTQRKRIFIYQISNFEKSMCFPQKMATKGHHFCEVWIGLCSTIESVSNFRCSL